MGRTHRTLLALVAAAALTLAACGGDDGDEPPTSSDTEGAEGAEGAEDLCAALQDVADLRAEIEALADGDDWAATQEAYAELGPALSDAYHTAAGAATDWTAISDLRLLRQRLDMTVELAASASTAEEFATKVADLPGAPEEETSTGRLDDYANAECGFALSG